MEEFLFTEKYRPHTIDSTILPEDIKDMFRGYVTQKNIPNLLLVGHSGVGKTTIAMAMLDELNANYMMVNGSLDGTKDMLRNDIRDFATSMSLNGGRKYVILDEADFLTRQMQASLRNFMESYSNNCGFLLTCNHKYKIIPEIQSRCSTIEFKFSKEDKIVLVKEMYKRASDILTAENITFDKKVLMELILNKYPDFRKVLNELQKYSVTGKIDSGIFANFSDLTVKNLFDAIKKKSFDDIRKWVNENDIEESEVYRKIYDVGASLMKSDSIPVMVLILARYQYQSAFALDKEINLVACLLEIAVECNFK